MLRRLVTPTVEIHTQIPVDQANHWRWTAHSEYEIAGQEPVFSHDELHRVMLGYGAVMAQILLPQGPRAFRLLAHGLISGRTIGVYYLVWDTRLGRYEPEGDPFLIWDWFSEKIIADLQSGMSTTQAIRVHHC